MWQNYESQKRYYEFKSEITSLTAKLRVAKRNYEFNSEITSCKAKLRVAKRNYKLQSEITSLKLVISLSPQKKFHMSFQGFRSLYPHWILIIFDPNLRPSEYAAFCHTGGITNFLISRVRLVNSRVG